MTISAAKYHSKENSESVFTNCSIDSSLESAVDLFPSDLWVVTNSCSLFSGVKDLKGPLIISSKVKITNWDP